MRTARSLTVCRSGSICPGECVSHPPAMDAPPCMLTLPRTPPIMRAFLPYRSPCHTCPPRTCTHPPRPCMPALWTESQTPVKISPCPNFVAGGNKRISVFCSLSELLRDRFTLTYRSRSFLTTIGHDLSPILSIDV